MQHGGREKEKERNPESRDTYIGEGKAEPPIRAPPLRPASWPCGASGGVEPPESQWIVQLQAVKLEEH